MDWSEAATVVEARFAARNEVLTAEQRMRATAEMFEAARALIDVSLPLEKSLVERRLAVAQRIYGDELPMAALLAHAHWPNKP